MVRVVGHTHIEGGPACSFRTKKDCEENYADWQAFQQVLLAYRIALSGATKPYRKDKGVMAQLVQYIAGERDEIVNEDGNPSQQPFVRRLRAAIARFKAGDIPAYNLYDIPTKEG